MPFYVGVDMPEWETLLESEETNAASPPERALFKYIRPEFSETGVLSFPRDPEPRGAATSDAPSTKPGLFARLLGRRGPAAPSQPAPQIESFEDLMHRFLYNQAGMAAEALQQIARRAVDCRARGISRIHGTYDGGNDESFGHLTRVEMQDGRILTKDSQDLPLDLETLEDLVEVAASALMGRHDAGEFSLRGALAIDAEQCTIADERDRDRVFDAFE